MSRKGQSHIDRIDLRIFFAAAGPSAISSCPGPATTEPLWVRGLLIGIALAWVLYSADGKRAARCAAAMGAVYSTVKQKFYIDEVYLFVTRRVLFRFVARPIAWFDRHIVDGGVNLSGWITRTTGAVLRFLQTGQIQAYGVWFVGGALLVLLVLWAGRP